MKSYMFVIAMFLTSTLIGCAATPEISDVVDNRDKTRGFVQVNKTGFDAFWVSGEDALQGYGSVYFAPVKLEEVEIDNSRLSLYDKEWVLTDQDKSITVDYFAKAAANVFTKSSDFTWVAEPEADSLQVEFKILNFTPTASRDADRTGVREKVYSRSVGRMSLTAEVTDANTGKLIAVFDDVEEIGDTHRLERNDRINNLRQLRLSISKWHSDLEKTLSAIQ